LLVKPRKEESFLPLHDGTFTLNPGEEKFFSVAYRHEYIVRNGGIIDSIQFSIPYHEGAFLSGGPRHWVPKGTYLITLKAEASEVRPHEVICKLWVDDNGKLRLARA
jgi:hypothetical protein